jgi:hypothetical protein
MANDLLNFILAGAVADRCTEIDLVIAEET